MGSSKKVTVGYRYYMGLQFGLCHGPVDAVKKVSVGDRTAWLGLQESSGSIAVVAPELFGGDKREGGVYGVLDIQMGEPAQTTNSYLTSILGPAIPAFRGILSAVWRGGQVAANNPYIKPWAFTVKRILNGWTTGAAWYAEKAELPRHSEDLFTTYATTFDSLSGWSYSGTSDSFELVDGALRTKPNPANINPALATSPTFYGYMRSLDVDFTIVSMGGGSDVGALSVAPFRFSVGDQSDYDALQRPYITTHSDIVGGNYMHSAAFSVGVPYHLRVDIDYNADTVTGVVTSGGSIVCSQTVDVNRTPVTAGVAEFSVETSWMQPGTVDWDNLTIVAEIPYCDMNPAHIVYQCLTDSAWGMGYPTSIIDSASFTAAADALYAEGFGLSFLWNQQETIEAFIQIVLDHIGALLYVRPDSGAFALKLIRADYDRATLPIYGPETLISVSDYQRQAWGETINEITVIYTNPATGKDVPATAQDIANIQIQGGVVAQTRRYPGIRSAGLAQRVALRDLQSVSTPIARVKLTATRAAWQVFPGDVFRLTWPEYGISDVVYRALAVNRGTLQDGQIIIDAAEDVFGLPDNTYLVEQPSEWEDPTSEPAPAPWRKMLETPYWDLVRTLSSADMAYVDALSGYLETLAIRPSGDATNYGIEVDAGGGYQPEGNGDFCPSATIDAALTKTTTSITLANGVDLDLVAAGGYAIIDNEYVTVSAIDPIAGTATLARGVLDTVPTEHGAGSRIWFADGFHGFTTTEYADGETLNVKLLPMTGRGELALAAAPVDSLTFDQRQYRPYPPGKVRFDGVEWPAVIDGSADVVLTWAHRDRLSQTAYIVDQYESSIGPEAGVTYSLEVADEALTVLHSATGISADTATVPASSLTAGLLRFRLWSVRGGLASMQRHDHWAIWGDVRTTEAADPRITESGEYRITE